MFIEFHILETKISLVLISNVTYAFVPLRKIHFLALGSSLVLSFYKLETKHREPKYFKSCKSGKSL